MPLKIRIPLFLFFCAALGLPSLRADWPENFSFPSAALDSLFNVVTDFGANPSQGSDDTAAFQAAFVAARQYAANTPEQARAIYIPDGVYTLSDTVFYTTRPDRGGLILLGESRDGVIIRLANNTPGFTDAANPKAILQVWKGDPNGSVSTGGMSFHNYFMNLTIDAGSGNHGAIGIDQYNHNVGGIRNVRITATDGYVGIFTARTKVGVGYNRNVEIEGFQFGIQGAGGGGGNGYTFEHLTLSGQSTAGINLGDKRFTIRNLQSNNSVPAITMNNRKGVLVLMDSDLSGGSSGDAAILKDDGTIHLSRTDVSGYGTAVRRSNVDVVPSGSALVYYSRNHHNTAAGSPDFFSLYENTPEAAIGLSVLEAPQIPWDTNHANWAVLAPSSNSTTNRTNLQNAINSGKTTLFLAPGEYRIDAPIHLRNNIRRIYGSFSQIKRTFEFDTSIHENAFVIEALNHAVVIEAFARFGGGSTPAIRNESNQPVILRDLFLNQQTGTFYYNTGVGDLFIENVKTRHNQDQGPTDYCYIFGNGARVFARNFNPEGQAGNLVMNDGAELWVLGGKGGEKRGPHFHTKGGGRTEVYGFWLNVNSGGPNPLVINEDSDVALMGMYYAQPVENSVNPYIREIRGSEIRDLLINEVTGAPASGHHFAPMPFYRGDSRSETGQLPADPTNLVSTTLSSSEIDLQWEDNSINEDYFVIQVSTGGNFSWFGNYPGVPGTRPLIATADGLDSGTEYTFRIKAGNAFGDSAFTNTATATTQPSGSTSTMVTFNGVSLPTSFGSGTFTGADALEWNYFDVRNDGNRGIPNRKYAEIKKESGYLQVGLPTATLTGLSFDARSWYGDSTLIVSADGSPIWSTLLSGPVAHYTSPPLSIPGESDLKLSLDAGSRNVSIDNIELTFSAASLEETFDGAGFPANSFGDGSFLGQSGIDWDYTDIRNDGTRGINDSDYAELRRQGNASLSTELSTAVSSVSFAAISWSGGTMAEIQINQQNAGNVWIDGPAALYTISLQNAAPGDVLTLRTLLGGRNVSIDDLTLNP